GRRARSARPPPSGSAAPWRGRRRPPRPCPAPSGVAPRAIRCTRHHRSRESSCAQPSGRKGLTPDRTGPWSRPVVCTVLGTVFRAASWAVRSAPGARDRAPLGIAGCALQPDHGAVAELVRSRSARVGEGGADARGDLVEQVLDTALALGEVHAGGGDALLEQALAGAGEGVLVR